MMKGGVDFVIENFFLHHNPYNGDHMKQYQTVGRNLFINKKYQVYPLSVNVVETGIIAMIHQDQDYLLPCLGDLSKNLNGEKVVIHRIQGKKCPLTHENAHQLRQVLRFTAPIPVLREDRSFGVGDHQGIASLGHISI